MLTAYVRSSGVRHPVAHHLQLADPRGPHLHQPAEALAGEPPRPHRRQGGGVRAPPRRGVVHRLRHVGGPSARGRLRPVRRPRARLGRDVPHRAQRGVQDVPVARERGGDGRGPLHPEDPCLAGRSGAMGRPRACRGLLPRVPDAAAHRGGGRAPARGAGRLPRGRPRRDPRDEPARDPVRRRGVPVRLEPGRPPRHHRLGPDPWPRDAGARAHDRLVDLPRDRGAHRGRGHPAGPPGGDHVGEQPEHELRRERLPGHARPGRVPARRCRRRDVDPAPRRRTPGGEPPRGRPPRGPGR